MFIYIFFIMQKIYILIDNCPKDTTDASLLSVYSQHELCPNYNHYKVNAVRCVHLCGNRQLHPDIHFKSIVQH